MTVVIDDRALRHLQVVITAKLRRNESLAFTWGDDPGVSTGAADGGSRGGHGAVWLSRSSALSFRYDGAPSGDTNRAWLDALAAVANSNSGLRLIPEPIPSRLDAANRSR